MNEITRILAAVQQGQAEAAEQLLPVIYDELRKIAAYKMAGEAPGHTLQATALVHEAWLRLAGSEQQNWANRAHFFSAAAEAKTAGASHFFLRTSRARISSKLPTCALRTVA